MSYFNPKVVDWSNKPHWAEAVATLHSAPYKQIFWIGSHLYSKFMSEDGKTSTNGFAFSSDNPKKHLRNDFKLLVLATDNISVDKEKPKYSPYHRLIQSQYNPIYDADGKFLGLMVDAYDVFEAFDPQDRTEPETHALKKLLIPGKRGAKEIIQDIKEAIWSLNLSLVKRIHREAKNKYLNK